jgi:hypothetical protein
MRLTCKDKLKWSSGADRAFQDLRTAFTTVPILIRPDFSRPFFLESNTFDYALGAVLSQKGDDEQVYLVVFYLRKFITVEINYEILDKELLTIVDSFQEWKHFFEGVVHPITVYTDHKNLEYFMFARVLNRCQSCWSLSRFNFMITYRPGFQHG